MTLQETIELNGKEYTVELNRESIVRIEQYINLKEVENKINYEPYSDKSEVDIAKGEDPFAEKIDDEAIINQEQNKIDAVKKAYTRAFWIWLYPVEKLDYEEVKEILEPYFEEEEKVAFIFEKFNEFSSKSVEVRREYIDELKNLKAQTK